ncbi:MAG: helix-turn-helix transcriptional regulator [bacterium]
MQTSTEALRAYPASNEPASETSPDEINLIDTETACAIVGGTKPIHRSTLWRLVKAGKLPPPNKMLRRWDRRAFVAAVKALYEEAA